ILVSCYSIILCLYNVFKAIYEVKVKKSCQSLDLCEFCSKFCPFTVFTVKAAVPCAVFIVGGTTQCRFQSSVPKRHFEVPFCWICTKASLMYAVFACYTAYSYAVSAIVQWLPMFLMLVPHV